MNRKIFLPLLIALALVMSWMMPLALADFGDEATLGGQDSSSNYRWRVTGDGHLIPGADATTNIGDATHQVEDIYVNSDLRFQTSLFATGHNSGSTILISGASNLTVAQLAFGLIRKASSSDMINDIADGSPGQMITLMLDTLDGYWFINNDTGNMTMTGWTQITFNSAKDTITLLWLDDTTGWIIVANGGCLVE